VTKSHHAKVKPWRYPPEEIFKRTLPLENAFGYFYRFIKITDKAPQLLLRQEGCGVQPRKKRGAGKLPRTYRGGRGQLRTAANPKSFLLPLNSGGGPLRLHPQGTFFIAAFVRLNP